MGKDESLRDGKTWFDCQPPKCRLHEEDIVHCTHCTRIGKPECTLITKAATCGKCGAEYGHCTHKNGF